eukprot:COSAG02_NODE_17_length_55377_cov_106.402258_26_plen_70_part_00
MEIAVRQRPLRQLGVCHVKPGSHEAHIGAPIYSALQKRNLYIIRANVLETNLPLALPTKSANHCAVISY